MRTFGVGFDTAAALLVAVGDNPERLRCESAFAALCGVTPIPASSGKTNRHRLNRGGDRRANAAPYRVVIVRLCHDDRIKEYMRRRIAEGMTSRRLSAVSSAMSHGRFSPACACSVRAIWHRRLDVYQSIHPAVRTGKLSVMGLCSNRSLR